MNQKIKYVGLFAILPLFMVALSPDLIGDADARKGNGVDGDFVSQAPYIEKVSVTPFSAESPDSYKASFLVYAGGLPMSDVTILVTSDRDQQTTEIAGISALSSSLATVIIKASDPSSTSVEILDWKLND